MIDFTWDVAVRDTRLAQMRVELDCCLISFSPRGVVWKGNSPEHETAVVAALRLKGIGGEVRK